MAQACPRCGGEIALDVGATFGRCSYCQASVVRDGDAVLSRYIVPSRLSPEAARRALDRWMVGNEPSRWLSLGAKIEAPELVWLPVWYARTQTEGGNVVVHERRADDGRVPEVKRRLIPGSGLRSLDTKGDPAPALPEPTVPWASFATELAGAKTLEQSLVHVPFYRFVYRYRGRRYTAAVNGATSEVRPGRYPKRPSRPFVLLSLAAIATFAVADLWYGAARFWDQDRPHIFPIIYPLALLGFIVAARLLTAVF